MTINDICLSQIEDRVNEDKLPFLIRECLVHAEFEDEEEATRDYINQQKEDIKWLVARVRTLELELHNAERELKATYDGVIICR